MYLQVGTAEQHPDSNIQSNWRNYAYKYTVKKLVHIKGSTAFNRLLISWRIRQWLRQW